MICSNCGKEINDGSKFCIFCGGSQQTAAPVEATPVAPVAPVEAAPVAPVAPVEAAPVAPVAPVEAAPVAPVVPEAEPTVVMQAMAGDVPPMQQPMAGAVPPMQQPVAGAVPPMQQPMAGAVPPMQQPMAGAVPPMQGGVQPVPPAQPKKKSKAGLIIVLVLVVLLLAGGGIFAFMWMNRPITKVADAFAEGDMDQVVEIYEEVGEKDKAEVEAQAKTYAIDMVDNYLSGAEDVDYETLSETLESLCEDILADDEEVAAKVQLAQAVNASREAFETAEEHKANGNYQEALASYAEVIADDAVCYDDAQAAITEVKDTVRSEAIAEAEEYMSWEDYWSARDVLNGALAILPDDAELQDALVAVDEAEVQGEVDYYIECAMDYVEWGYYSDAIYTLESALEMYPGNSDLTAALEAVTEEMYAANPLLGKWAMEIDLSDMLAEEMGIEAGAIETAFIVNMIFEFGEDGDYMIYVDEESFREVFMVWIDECIDYEIQVMCDEYGITLEEMDEMFVEMYGMTLEEYLNVAMEDELGVDELIDDATSSMEASGVYETEGDRIYMSEYYIDYSVYDIFTVEGNTLTISLADGMEFESSIPGVEYPFVLTRVQ